MHRATCGRAWLILEIRLAAMVFWLGEAEWSARWIIKRFDHVNSLVDSDVGDGL